MDVLPRGEKSLRMFSRLTQYRRVTDRQTDILTRMICILRYARSMQLIAWLTRTVLTRRVSSYGLSAWVSSELGPMGGRWDSRNRRNFSKRQLIGRNAWLICINGDFRQLPATFLLCLTFLESQKSIEFGHMSCRL